MLHKEVFLTGHVLFVSAGMDKPKKRDNVLSRRQQYLNYGALTLATILNDNGYEVRLVHGGHTNPISFVNEIREKGYLNTRYPIMLSITSFYALTWAQEFTKELKLRFPKFRIILGGRWVIGEDSEWLSQKLPFVDLIVGGLAESKILDLVRGIEYSKASTNPQNRTIDFNLNHTLVEDYQKFQPSIEASRGCGMGCAFCEERSIPLTPLKSPEMLIEHLHGVAEQYDDYDVRPYVQSSFFIPPTRWAENLAKAALVKNKKILWRCETRVDAIKADTISSLAAAGLKVIDLGLESASPTQILKMEKSLKPERYLRAASDLLYACKENGVMVKLNFLIYAGETFKTFNETISWLDNHKELIKGISVGPVVVFGPPKSSVGFLKKMKENGGSLVFEDSIEKTGIGHIHPSTSISQRDAEDMSLETSKKYMTQVDYFDLKSFSYYPRDYRYNDFLNDVDISEKQKLPFRLT